MPEEAGIRQQGLEAHSRAPAGQLSASLSASGRADQAYVVRVGVLIKQEILLLVIGVFWPV